MDMEIMQARGTLDEFIEFTGTCLRSEEQAYDQEAVEGVEALLKVVATIFIASKQTTSMMEDFMRRFGDVGE